MSEVLIMRRQHPTRITLCILLCLVWRVSIPAGTGDVDETDEGLPSSFVSFDRELRHALSTEDAAAVALLVRFPLRLNHDDGSVTSLVNPRALQVRWKEAFPPEVRVAVLEATPDDLIVRDYTIGYRGGAVWVERLGEEPSPRYRVTTVNLPASTPHPVVDTAPPIVFVCETNELRMIVDVPEEGKPRFRAWNRPRPLHLAPDIEISTGREVGEGTWPCTRFFWQFADGDRKYTVGQLGCTDRSVPHDAFGTFDVEVGDASPAESWCF